MERGLPQHGDLVGILQNIHILRRGVHAPVLEWMRRPLVSDQLIDHLKLKETSLSVKRLDRRQGVTIGDNVMIAANSVVTRDIPSNSMADGVPAVKK